MKKANVLLTVLLCLNLAFIWGNSMLNGADSAKVSNVVTGAVEKVIDSVSNPNISDLPKPIETSETQNSPEISRKDDSVTPEAPKTDEKDEKREYFEYVLEIIVRKCAHMFEFFLLAVWVTLLLKNKYPTILLCGIITALLDETIQLYSGRSSRVADVWIDTLGFILGILFTVLIRHLHFRKKSSI